MATMHGGQDGTVKSCLRCSGWVSPDFDQEISTPSRITEYIYDF